MIARTMVLLVLAGASLLGTACVDLFATKRAPAKEAAMADCAGLGGEARVDCERRHPK